MPQDRRPSQQHASHRARPVPGIGGRIPWILLCLLAAAGVAAGSALVRHVVAGVDNVIVPIAEIARP